MWTGGVDRKKGPTALVATFFFWLSVILRKVNGLETTLFLPFLAGEIVGSVDASVGVENYEFEQLLSVMVKS